MSPDGSPLIVAEVVTRAGRSTEAPPSRLSRVRCKHCAMPLRRSHPRCWSCGLDPARPVGADEPQAPEAGPSRPDAGRRRWTVVVGGGLLLVLIVVLLSLATPVGSGQGVRGLAARLRGDAWARAGVPGASAEFPSPPARRSLSAAPGLLEGGEALVATGPGLHVELRVQRATTGSSPGLAAADQLVARYAADVGGRVAQRTPRTDGDDGVVVDAVVDGPGGLSRLRATVLGPTACLLAVAGPPEAFDRFTASFERPA